MSIFRNWEGQNQNLPPRFLHQEEIPLSPIIQTHSGHRSHALPAFWCCVFLRSVIWLLGTDSVSATDVSCWSASGNTCLEVGDFGEGLCLWNMMPCAYELICQPLPYLQSHKPGPSCRESAASTAKQPACYFCSGHPCCVGAVAEGWMGVLEQQVSVGASVEASASSVCKVLTPFPTGGKAVWVDLPTPHRLGAWGGWGWTEPPSKAIAMATFCRVFPLWCQFSNGKYFMCHHKTEILQSYRALFLKPAVK